VTVETLSKPSAHLAHDRDWWRGAVIYQVYPRSFADSNGDGVGDLPGVTAHLEHVASLGVDAIWLSPFFTSPMKDFGYDVSNYEDVDPDLRDPGRLRSPDRQGPRPGLEGDHRPGVLAHLRRAPVVQGQPPGPDQPHADWYVWADAKPDGSPPSNWQSVFGGPSWTWDARRRQYYLHNFLSAQPDLNVHSPQVQDALIATSRFWLERGVDGFRFDAINFAMHDQALTDNPPILNGEGKRNRPFDFQHHFHNQSHDDIPAFLTRLRQLGESYGGRFMVAEVGGERADSEMKLYTQGPDRLHSAYGFLYLYADTLTADLIRQGAAMWPGEEGQGWPSWTFSNHDAPRAVSRWAQGRDPKAFADMSLLLLVSLRGNVFIYQGEELGLPQAEVPYDRLQDPEAIANWPETLGRDGARTPMPWVAVAAHAGFSKVEPWLPIDPSHIDLAVDRQERDGDSTLNLTRRVVALRRRLPGLRTGGMTLVEAPEPLLVFLRGEGADQVLCAFNLGFEAAAWDLPAGWRIVESVNLDGEGELPRWPGWWRDRVRASSF
jgi:alpha-glucosidase